MTIWEAPNPTELRGLRYMAGLEPPTQYVYALIALRLAHLWLQRNEIPVRNAWLVCQIFEVPA